MDALSEILSGVKLTGAVYFHAEFSAPWGVSAPASKKPVGKSLGLLHSRIAHPWTIADLADEVGISRSALVERFTKYLSEPPMAYLTRWRLQVAARSLEKTSRGIADIAADVGYESEAAFNRAFKREFGQPPGRYRSSHKNLPSTATGERGTNAKLDG
jgi:transcriptional regulator GlxA family with amidase domain